MDSLGESNGHDSNNNKLALVKLGQEIVKQSLDKQDNRNNNNNFRDNNNHSKNINNNSRKDTKNSFSISAYGLKTTKEAKKKFLLTNHFFTLSLLEYICNLLNSHDRQSAENQFQEICHKLIEYNIIAPNLASHIFKPIRFQYQKLLHAIFNQYNYLPPRITYKSITSSGASKSSRLVRNSTVDDSFTSLNSPKHPLLKRAISTDSSINYNENQVALRSNLIDSRYYSDFVELEKIASGGFGSVYRAKNRLDNNEYAIKKICFKKSTPDFCEKVLRETRLFSSLSHENIVSYHSSWLEFEIIPQEEEKEERTEPNSISLNKEKPSDITNIIFGFSSDQSNKSSKNLEVAKVNQNHDTNETSSTCSGENKGLFRQTAITGSGFTTTTENSFTDNNKEIQEKSENTSSLSIDIVKKPVKNKTRNREKSQCESLIVLYIQMKLCDLTLKEWLQLRNKEIFSSKSSINEIDNEKCLNIFRRILSAVEYIHSRSIIHRDLKPGNIFLIRESLQVKIGDFGLACMDMIELERTVLASEVNYSRTYSSSPIVESPNGSRLNLAKEVEHTKGVGTSLYASPEQISGKCYDSKTDMYSLGIILFELYCPFKTEMERMLNINDLKNNLTFPNNMENKWNRECQIIKSLLQKTPSERPSAFLLSNNEIFMSKDQIIDNLHKLLQQKDLEINRLNNQLKEKDELINGILQLFNTN